MLPQIGDLAFTVDDFPVRVAEIGPAFTLYGLTPALVEFLRPDGSIAAVGVESAGDLLPETHAEFTVRSARPDWRPGEPWPWYRRAADGIPGDMRGIAFPGWMSR